MSGYPIVKCAAVVAGAAVALCAYLGWRPDKRHHQAKRKAGPEGERSAGKNSAREDARAPAHLEGLQPGDVAERSLPLECVAASDKLQTPKSEAGDAEGLPLQDADAASDAALAEAVKTPADATVEGATEHGLVAHAMDDDALNDLASGLGSTESMAPEEALARMQAQNQVLWVKLRGLNKIEAENTDLKASVRELKDQLDSDNAGAAKENSELRAEVDELKFKFLMYQSDAASHPDGLAGERSLTMEGLNASNQESTTRAEISRENERKLLKQLDDLRSALDKSKAECQHLEWKLVEQEEQVALCETLEAENLRLKVKLEQQPGQQAQCTSLETPSQDVVGGVDIGFGSLYQHNSKLQQENKELVAEVEQLRLKLAQLESQKSGCQRALSDMKFELLGCQQDQQAAEEERDELRVMVHELQEYVDELSVPDTIQLKMSVSRLEADVSRLAADNEVLTMQLRAVNAQADEDLAGVPMRSTGAQDSVLECSESEDNRSPFAMGAFQVIQESEKLDDLSELVAEMVEIAGSGRCERLGLSLSHVQYAGLLAAIQKAIEEVEAAKQKSILGGADKFAVLERSLSNSLSISGTPRESNGGLIAAHLGEIEKMAADRVACIEELNKMTMDLKSEVREGADLTVHQEMRMEYLLQQLSCPDKVLKLSWQVESLKQCVDSSQREVEALRELNDQQQQELAIQWEKKQQAMAENRAHHSQASMVSEQFENLKEAADSLTWEKQELEEELKNVSKELQSVRSSCGSAHESVQQQLVRLEMELAVVEDEYAQAQEREEEYKQTVIDLENKLMSSGAECQRAHEALAIARKQYADAAQQWQEELDALAAGDIPRGKWPKAVRELVEKSEQEARDSTLTAEEGKLEVLRCELAGERNCWKSQTAKDQGRILEAEMACRTAELRVEQLQGEMKKREQQLASVQERARITVAQKDDELQLLKDHLHASSTSPDPPSLPWQTPYPADMEAIATPTQVTARGPPVGLVSLGAHQAPKDSEIVLENPRSDSQEEFFSMEDGDNELLASCAVADRMVHMPVVFEGCDGVDPVEVSTLDSTDSMSEVDKLKSKIESLKEQVQELMLDAEDNERTHALRNKADEILKEEIAELQRSSSRDTVDKGYLKNVLVSAFEKGTLSSDSPMVEILSRLLSFSPDDMQRIQKGRDSLASTAQATRRERTFMEWAGLA